MSKETKETKEEVIADIHQKLYFLEELLMWTISADTRFRKGQRVKMSHIAERRKYRFFAKCKSRKGTVLEVDKISVKVLMDNYKHPSSVHHMFLSKV